MNANPLDQVTPLLITFNEESNISRCLSGLSWARRIVVVDSGSTDATLSLLASAANVDVFYRRFDSFASQCNYGLRLIETDWCLSLDADHCVPVSFLDELSRLLLVAAGDVSAFQCSFRYWVYGRPLRGALLPPRYSVVRPRCGTYINDGHAHYFAPRGSTLAMMQPLFHDDRKPLSRWLSNQHIYLLQESDKLISTPSHLLSLQDRIRKNTPFAPFAVLFVCLIWHRGLFDGWRGWFYALQRVYAEIHLSLLLFEAKHSRLV